MGTITTVGKGCGGGKQRRCGGKGIKPLIQMRSLWQTEPERMLPGHDGSSNVVYDEAGTIYCYDKVSEPPVRHQMSYIGYEPERETLKYRCPAKHEEWECPMSTICERLDNSFLPAAFSHSDVAWES